MTDWQPTAADDGEVAYRRLFEVFPDPMWVYDLATLRFLAVNDAAIAHYGYDRDTFLAMTIADIRPSADVRALEEAVSKISGGLDRAGIWRHQKADGTLIWVEITSHTLMFEGRRAEVVLAHDVTAEQQQQQQTLALNADLQQLNQTLQQQEAALKTAQRIGNMGSWEAYLDRDEILWSDQVYTIFGVERSGFGGTCGSFFEFVHPDDRAPYQAELDNVLARHGNLDTQHRIIRPDGTIRIVHERAELLETSQGLVLAGTVQDVTERVTAEARAREHDYLRQIAGRVARLGGWSVDLLTQEATWSDEVCAIHDLPPGSQVSLTEGIAFYAPEYRDRIRTVFTACTQQGVPFQEELQIITAKGRRVWVMAIGEAVWDEAGHIVKVQGGFQDISERKQMEVALVLSEQRFRQLAEALPQMVWTAEPDGGVDYANGSYYRYRGISGLDLPAQEWLEGLYPDDVNPCLAAWSHSIATGQFYQIRFRIRRYDGEYRWHLVTAEPIRDRDQRIIKWYGSAVDIHDLTLAEAQVQQLANRLNTTLESISDGFYTLDRQWQFTFINSEGERLLRRSRQEILHQNVWQAFPAAVDTMLYNAYQQAMETGQSYAFELYYAPLAGWFEISVYPSAEGLAVYFRDVTARHAANAQLRLLETAINCIDDLVVIIEAEPGDESDPAIVYVNQAFEQRTGYRRNEAIGATPRIVEGILTQSVELAKIRANLAIGLPLRTELINYTTAGETFWQDLSLTPITDAQGQVTHWVAVGRDITERKHIEQQLAQQAALLNETQDAIVVRDMQHHIQFWNRSATALYGWSAAAAQGQSVETLLYRDPTAFHQAHAVVVQQGAWRGILTQYRQDGTPLTVECNWTLVCNQDGQPQRILAVNTDISDRLALEEQLRQSQRLEAVGQLTGGIAHDFNNLLTVILSNAELLAEQLEHAPDLQSLAAMTQTAAQRGAELTHRLLAFARRQALDPKVVQVNILMTEMDILLRRTLGANIEIEVVQGGGLWNCLIDLAQLEAALLNLCLNARDAMPDGGKLTVETANAHLDLNYADLHAEVTPGQYVRIAITDTGTGILPDDLPRVFDPFFTTKAAGKGTGLGLSMVYGFVKQSGGHIKLYSELGQGTTVKLYLPRAYTSESTPRSVPEHDVPQGDETILVVEDDDLVRANVSQQLQQLGYRVHIASTASTALQILRQQPMINLLFTDVMLPGGINGRQLAEAAQQIRPDLNVLYTSGYTENAIVHHGRLDPGVQLLSKPYRLQDLARMIRLALDREDR